MGSPHLHSASLLRLRGSAQPQEGTEGEVLGPIGGRDVGRWQWVDKVT